jgi:hypothetical protein
MLFGDVPDMDIVSIHYFFYATSRSGIYVIYANSASNNPILPILSNVVSTFFFAIAVCTFRHVPSKFQYYLKFTKGLTILH